MCPGPLREALRPSLIGLTAFAALPPTATAATLDLLNGEAAPPPRYLSGPTLTGRTVEVAFDSRKALRAFCNQHLGKPAAGAFYACYVPALDVVAVPSARAWPDAAEREALRAHEWAHARGWRHPLRLHLAAQGASAR